MLDDFKHHSKVVGMKQTTKAVEADMVQTVYIAKDADERLVSKIADRCRVKGIKVIEVESMRVLGKACRIDVGTAVAAILKE
ncbi:MAG TPA: ribosomal L7Ae/L30e/S12e/Gadd45 family protein [Clostridia bacterium]